MKAAFALPSAKNDPGYRALFVLLLCVSVIWIASGFFLAFHLPPGEWAKHGAFGDMFGAVNSLFSAAAFAGIIFTIFLQKRELALQREEMQKVATSGVASARLAALSQLIRYYDELRESYRPRAFRELPDSNAIGGRRIQTVNQDAADQFGELSKRHAALISELEAVYQSLPRATTT